MDSCVPLPLEPDKLMDLVDKAKDYCLMHGICMRQKDRSGNGIFTNAKFNYFLPGKAVNSRKFCNSVVKLFSVGV